MSRIVTVPLFILFPPTGKRATRHLRSFSFSLPDHHYLPHGAPHHASSLPFLLCRPFHLQPRETVSCSLLSIHILFTIVPSHLSQQLQQTPAPQESRGSPISLCSTYSSSLYYLYRSSGRSRLLFLQLFPRRHQLLAHPLLHLSPSANRTSSHPLITLNVPGLVISLINLNAIISSLPSLPRKASFQKNMLLLAQCTPLPLPQYPFNVLAEISADKTLSGMNYLTATTNSVEY